MSSISYSGNYFSEEDERRELNELSEAERQSIIHDMYGRDTSTAATDGSGADNVISTTAAASNRNTVSPNQLRQFYETLLQIPTENCSAFWYAWSEVEHIVETESDPALFLRYANYDYHQAVLRLCEYWNVRYEIFGEDYAFEPMHVDGAMNHVVHDMVQLPNFCRVLPNDAQGRTVFCLDRTNMKFKDFDDSTILKIVWFGLHEAVHRRSTQDNGLVIIQINQSSSWDFPSRKIMKMVTKMISDALPMKICCRHLCVSSLIVTLTLPIGKLFWPRHERLRTQVHQNNVIQNPSLIRVLETFGLHSDNLPNSIGGSYTAHAEWIGQCESILESKENDQGKKRQKYE